MHTPLPYTLKLWGELGVAAGLAAETGARRAYEALRPKRKQNGGTVRHPGQDTPLWNVLAIRLKEQLKPYGSKVRLARHLGIPPQRLSDYLSARSRLPDAELTLRLAYWLCEAAEGRDASLTLPSPKPGRPRIPKEKR